MLHKPMPKSMTENKNGVWMAGSTWSGMKPVAGDGWLFIDLVRAENKNLTQKRSKYLLVKQP